VPPPPPSGLRWGDRPIGKIAAIAAVLLAVLVFGVLLGTGVLGGSGSGSSAGGGSPGGAASDPGSVAIPPDTFDGSGGASSSGDSGGFPAPGAEETLYSHIPSSYTDCKTADPPLDTNADAAIDCTANGDITVEYLAYSDDATMYAQYDSYSAGKRNYGSCPDDVPSETTWSETTNGPVAGRDACWIYQDSPNMAWTDNSLDILVWAAGSGTMKELHDWWANGDSGPS
jgi:hypothetical protein